MNVGGLWLGGLNHGTAADGWVWYASDESVAGYIVWHDVQQDQEMTELCMYTYMSAAEPAWFGRDCSDQQYPSICELSEW